jgi:hypothetical protein
MPPTPTPNSVTVQTGDVSSSTTKSSVDIFLGSNINIKNVVSTSISKYGFSTSNLPITTNSVLNASALNIFNTVSDETTIKATIDNNGNFNSLGDISTTGWMSASTLYIYGAGTTSSATTTIDSNGDIVTNGYVTASGKMTASSFINTNQSFSVSTNGLITTSGGITSSGSISVTSGLNTAVNLSTNGTISATGDLRLDGLTFTQSSNDFKLYYTNNNNDITTFHVDTVGNTYSAGNLNINNKLTFNVATSEFTIVDSNNVQLFDMSGGYITSKGGITASNSKFIVDINGNVEASGNVIAYGKLQAGHGNFNADASGNVTTNGTLTMKNYAGTNTNLSVDSNGNMLFNNNGYVSTGFTNYVANPSSTDVNTMSGDPNGGWSSTTNNYLTTQEYVDKQIWNQTLRLNTITNLQSTNPESFKNVFQLITALEGETTATTISGFLNQTNNLVQQTQEVQMSVMKVANQAINNIPVLCSPNVWADCCTPLPIPTGVTNSQIDGWWYDASLLNNPPTGLVAPNVVNKINWYIPANMTNINGNMVPFTVSQLRLLYINLIALNQTSSSAPWISVFTYPKGTNDIFPNLANAKIELLFNNIKGPSSTGSPALPSNTNYCLYGGSSSSVVPANVFDSVLMPVSSVKCINGSTSTTLNNNFISTDGTIVSGSDSVAFFAIETSSSEKNTAFILQSFGIMGNNGTSVTETLGTTQFVFSNAGVSANFMYNSVYKCNSDFSPLYNTQSSQNNVYNSKYFYGKTFTSYPN